MWCKLPWLPLNCGEPGFLEPFFFYKSYLPSSSCAWFSSVWCSSSSFFSLLLPSDEAQDAEWTPSGCCSHWVFVHLQAVCQQRSTFAGQEEYLRITNTFWEAVYQWESTVDNGAMLQDLTLMLVNWQLGSRSGILFSRWLEKLAICFTVSKLTCVHIHYVIHQSIPSVAIPWPSSSPSHAIWSPHYFYVIETIMRKDLFET